MCTDDYAEEEDAEGSVKVNSVLLRITKHQNSCICHVNLEVTETNYTIHMSKYQDRSYAAPEQHHCGLAVDVDYVDTSITTRSLQPIECIEGTKKRSIALGGSELKFESRIINGDFTRGYCMQISRG